jgi:small-conductance mechanosensitive channel
MEVYGIRFVGLNPENGRKLLLTLGLVLVIICLRWLLRAITRALIRGNANFWRGRFWTHQGISVVSAVILIIGIISIWFDNPARLGTFVGLVTAGIAFALQKVITSLAGYFVILRGNTFSVGDRIVMGDVRGDVVALGFMQTTIMEMGQPPPVQSADPAMWVESRQFTGRIVTISNSEIFEKPVYNYSREFPYIWDEIKIPITYEADRARAESILLSSVNRHALNREKLGDGPVEQLHKKYRVSPIDLDPTVYYRLTDNWLELTVRFLAPDHGIRRVKDLISRDVITALNEAKIGIASGTYAIVHIPPIEIASAPQQTSSNDSRASASR